MDKKKKKWKPEPAWYETKAAEILAPIISSIVASIIVVLVCLWKTGRL